MATIQEFLAMGGYAFYVWTSYAIATVVLLGNVWYARSQSRQITRDIKHSISTEHLDNNNSHS